MNIIRYPAVAGMFYPEDPNELKNGIENFVRTVCKKGS